MIDRKKIEEAKYFVENFSVRIFFKWDRVSDIKHFALLTRDDGKIGIAEAIKIKKK